MTSLEGDISMNAGEVEEEEPKLTKTERRIVELKDVEEVSFDTLYNEPSRTR
jgi:hypothetical protein